MGWLGLTDIGCVFVRILQTRRIPTLLKLRRLVATAHSTPCSRSVVVYLYEHLSYVAFATKTHPKWGQPKSAHSLGKGSATQIRFGGQSSSSQWVSPSARGQRFSLVNKSIDENNPLHSIYFQWISPTAPPNCFITEAALGIRKNVHFLKQIRLNSNALQKSDTFIAKRYTLNARQHVTHIETRFL